jgi:hypothetical protein
MVKREPGKPAGLEALIRRGLDDLAALLLSREWPREDGGPMKIDRLLVDANWGKSTETVYKWARETPHAAVVTPSHGKYVGAASLPFSSTGRSRAIGSAPTGACRANGATARRGTCSTTPTPTRRSCTRDSPCRWAASAA